MSFQTELALASDYLNLERLRLGSRLSIRIPENPSKFSQVMLPSLVLLTLVENAVKHGIAKTQEGGEIAIEIEDDQQGVVVKVINGGSPFKEERSNRTGLKNVREKLNLLYGRRAL